MWKHGLLAGMAALVIVSANGDDKKPAAEEPPSTIELQPSPKPFDTGFTPIEIEWDTGPAKTARGTVRGLEVTAGQRPDHIHIYIGRKDSSCSVTIQPKKPGSEPVRVTTSEHRLQTALETAAGKGIEVEVSYIEGRAGNRLTKVRWLD